MSISHEDSTALDRIFGDYFELAQAAGAQPSVQINPGNVLGARAVLLQYFAQGLVAPPAFR